MIASRPKNNYNDARSNWENEIFYEKSMAGRPSSDLSDELCTKVQRTLLSTQVTNIERVFFHYFVILTCVLKFSSGHNSRKNLQRHFWGQNKHNIIFGKIKGGHFPTPKLSDFFYKK